MSRTTAATACALALAFSLPLAAAAQAPTAPDAHPTTSIYALATGGDYTVLEAGSQAPDFSYESSGGWTHLHDLRAQGHVLLLVNPGDDQMVALERERPRLLSMGVVPAAVLDRRATACRALANRLRLGYTVIPDTRRVIGGQLNAVDPASRLDAAAWFVIDRGGRVRDLEHGSWPHRPWTQLCATALGLPAQDAPLPASYHR